MYPANPSQPPSSFRKMQQLMLASFRKMQQLMLASLPDVLRGIVAAFILPAALYFKPGKLEIAADNHYALISLYSLCFVAAMLGKKFIDAILTVARSWLRLPENAHRKSSATAPGPIPFAGNPLRAGITAMAGGASLITGWALAILGATAVGLVGGKYLHPIGPFRYVYILFLPGWSFLAISIIYGEKVTRRLNASLFTNDEKLLIEIGRAMNTEYARQRNFFQLALLMFGAWLFCVLAWWVVTGDISGSKTISIVCRNFVAIS